MATKLRLHQGYQATRTQTAARSVATTQTTLRFPSHAVAAMAKHARAARLARAMARPETLSHQQLVSDVEATLAHMQNRLDDLQQQVENYRFPGDGPDRPRAA